MDFSDQRFQFSAGTHKDSNVIWIQFEKDKELIAHLPHYAKER